jgi:O-antigen/teichoic acid export membrane protein
MRVLRWTVVLAVATTGAFAVLARVTIHLLVGSQYDGAVTPLRLLLPGLVVLSAQTVISGYVVSRGYARVALTAWTIAAVTGIVADVFVIPVRGADGAAVVSSASYLLVLVLHLRALRAARRSEQDGTRTVPVPS